MAVLSEIMSLGNLCACTIECTKQSRWKESTQRYLHNMLVNNVELQDDVLSGNYRVGKTTNFTINERGKIRHIESPSVRDRIVQKAITLGVLIPRLIPYIIYDNYASIQGRGTSFARRRFEGMLRSYYRENGIDGYVLLIDIRKYFDSIDHEILKGLLAPRLREEPEDIRALIDYIIDTSSHSGKGLNLGSEAPQLFAIYYLNPIDTFIKVVKGVRYYGRYMDDMFVIGKSKENLHQLLREIEGVLRSLKLETNKRKTHIVKISRGFTYLQVKYNMLPSGKLLKRPSHAKIVRERRRLKAFHRLMSIGKMQLADIENCYKSWRGAFVCEHNACQKTLRNMDGLYNSLYPENADKQKQCRSVLFNQAFKDPELIQFKKYIV